MKNIFKFIGFYWTAILLPIVLIAMFFFQKNAQAGLIILLFYIFAYRPIIDFARLKAKHKINNIEFWKMFLPFYRIKYFRLSSK